MEGQPMGARPSSAPASVRRRRQIIAAARQLIREHGPDEIIVAEVARAAGVSVATVYNLVGTRDRLLLAVLDDAVTDVDLAVRLRDGAGPIDEVIAVLATAIDVLLSDPVVHRRVLRSLRRLPDGLWLGEGLERLLAERLEACDEAGLLRAGLPLDRLVVSLQLGFRGVLMSWVVGRLDEERVRTETELMACYVLAGATRPEPAEALEYRIDTLLGRRHVPSGPG